MKLAHVGDVHWGLNYSGPTPEARFHDICKTMDWVANRIIEENCDYVLFAGDAFKDARVFLDRASKEIQAFASWLRKLTNHNIPVIGISGTPSHDAIAAYELIQEMNIGISIICTSPKTVKLANGYSVVCLPGINRSTVVTDEEFKTMQVHQIHQIMTQRITETCQSMLVKCDGPAILLSHLTYDMADKGFEDVLMQHEPVLTQEAIAGYDLVTLGHIHRPQQNGNVFYCGSPERLSFNDEHITPGFWIHELGKRSRFIKTPAREFLTVELREDWVKMLIDDTSRIVATWPWIIEDKIIRVRYTCSEELNKQLNRKALEKALYDAGTFFVSEIKADIQRQDRARDQEVVESLGPVEALGKWGEQQKIAEGEIAELQHMTLDLLYMVGEVAS